MMSVLCTLRCMSKCRNEKFVRLSAMLKALSNENRLRIFVRLIQCCPPGTRCEVQGQFTQCVSELGKDLSIVASTLSHHMKELRQAGLISMERRGQKMECWVEPEIVEELSGFFGELNGQESIINSQ